MAQTGVPATHLAGLEKFAGKVFSGAQGDFSLDQYAYFDDTSLFSTAYFAVTSVTKITTGSTARLFSVAQGDTDPSLNRPLTGAETNLEGGSSGGKMAANNAYVALAGGFDIYVQKGATGGLGLAVPLNRANELAQCASNITWSWNVGGLSNPTINYEPIKMWPVGSGVSGLVGGDLAAGLANGSQNQMRKFAFPLFFPPQIAVNVNLTVGRTITFDTTAAVTGAPASNVVYSATSALNDRIAVAMHLRGYKLSQIRG